jgi:hypothetical protein
LVLNPFYILEPEKTLKSFYTKYLKSYAAHFEIKILVFTAFWSKITFFMFFKKSIEVFENWTFLKCPKKKIDPTLFSSFYNIGGVKLFNFY